MKPGGYDEAVASGNRTLDELASYAEGLGMDYLDPRSMLHEQAMAGTDVYHDYDVHLSIEGNRLVAAAVAEWIAGTNHTPR